MSHVVVEKNNLKAVKAGGHVEAVQNTVDMDNGNFIHLGDLVANEHQLFQVKTPDATSILSEEILLVHSPVVNYEVNLVGSEDFYNPANEPARAFHLSVGDRFTISNDGFDGTSAVDKYLIPQAGSTRLVVANDLTGNTRFACKIIDTSRVVGFSRKPATKVQVVRV